MPTFEQNIWLAVISSVLSGGVVGGIFTYFLNKKLDRKQRVLNMRKEIYSSVQGALAGFFQGALDNRRSEALSQFLCDYRQIQLWGSKNVIKQCVKFLNAIDKKNKKSQDEIDNQYKLLISAMREDLSGERLENEDIFVVSDIT